MTDYTIVGEGFTELVDNMVSALTDVEISPEALMKYMAKFKKAKEARQFLKDAGILDEDCNIAAPYKISQEEQWIMTEEQEEQIDYLIDEFKFEKVKLAMIALDWKWDVTGKGDLKIPSIIEMKSTAKKLLVRAIKYETVGSGGFEAHYTPEDKEYKESFSLKFVLTEFDTFDE